MKITMKAGLAIMLAILFFIFGYGAYFTVHLISSIPGITREAAEKVENFIWISSFGVWLLLTVFTVVTYKLIVSPLNQILQYAIALRLGKRLPKISMVLTFPEIIKLKDELDKYESHLLERLSSLAKSNEKLVKNMSEITTSVSTITDSISVYERQLEKAAESLESITSETENVTASVEEINANVQIIDKNAAESVAFSKTAAENVERAAEVVNRSIYKMKEISLVSERITALVKAFEDATSKIESFVSTIKRIADKTNLLALNAAIEAERAGEAGKGFAVVASEIRRLAEQSKEASLSINDTFKILRQHVDSAALMALEISRKIEEGSRLADEASEKLGVVTSSFEDIVARLEEISHSLNAISSSTDAVSSAMVDIAHKIEYVNGMLENNIAELETQMASISAIDGMVRDTFAIAESVAEDLRNLGFMTE